MENSRELQPFGKYELITCSNYHVISGNKDLPFDDG